jgi:hypothetical protein
MMLHRLSSILLVLFACQDTGCDCITPLDEPIAKSSRLYDVAQVRITPHLFDFIDSRLPELISIFMENGLEFQIPPFEAHACTPVIGTPCFNMDICADNCTLHMDIASANGSRIPPNSLAVDSSVTISGIIGMSGSLETTNGDLELISCDYELNMPKDIQAQVNMFRDENDNLLYFRIPEIDFALSENDIIVDCWETSLMDWAETALQWVIINTLNLNIKNQINDVIGLQMIANQCLPCDYYTLSCPDSSFCINDYCMQGMTCKIKPIGMVGAYDLGATISPSGLDLQAVIEFFVAAGQESETTSTEGATIKDDGLELRAFAAIETDKNECVPEIDPLEEPSLIAPPPFEFGNQIPGTDTTFMAGLAISDAFLDLTFYKVYLTGLLCLSISTDQVAQINTKILALAGLRSLDDLTNGQAGDVLIELLPTHVPHVQIGAGTWVPNEYDDPIIDDPLLTVVIPGLKTVLWAKIDGRMTKILTNSFDLMVRFSLDITSDNQLNLIIDEDSVVFENSTISDYELLGEDTETLKNLLPTIVGILLPTLTGSLSNFEIPSSLQGLAFEIVDIRGEMPHSDDSFYDYMAIYLNMADAEVVNQEMLETKASLVDIQLAEYQDRLLSAPKGPIYPRVILAVATNSSQPAEYSYRVNGSLWHTFQKGPEISISHPAFLFGGRHTVEIRARTPGKPMTLDPTPVKIELDIPSFDVEPQVSGQSDKNIPLQDNTQENGCSCNTDPKSSLNILLLLILFGLPFIQNRKRAN